MSDTRLNPISNKCCTALCCWALYAVHHCTLLCQVTCYIFSLLMFYGAASDRLWGGCCGTTPHLHPETHAMSKIVLLEPISRLVLWDWVGEISIPLGYLTQCWKIQYVVLFQQIEISNSVQTPGWTFAVLCRWTCWSHEEDFHPRERCGS